MGRKIWREKTRLRANLGQKYCNFLKFQFEIPLKGCLDKFLT